MGIELRKGCTRDVPTFLLSPSGHPPPLVPIADTAVRLQSIGRGVPSPPNDYMVEHRRDRSAVSLVVMGVQPPLHPTRKPGRRSVRYLLLRLRWAWHSLGARASEHSFRSDAHTTEQRDSTREFTSPVLFATSMSTHLILPVQPLGRVLLFAG